MPRTSLTEPRPDFQRIAENSTDIYFRMIFKTGLTYVSPGFESALGYSRGDWLDRPDFPRQLVDEQGQADFAAAVEQIGGGASCAAAVLQLKSKSGALMWVELFGVPVEDGAQSVIGMDGLVRDVSAHLQVADVLSQLSEEQRVLLNLQRELWSKRDLKQACDLIVSASQRFLRSDVCVLLLTGPDGETLQAISESGGLVDGPGPQSVRLGGDLLGRVIRLGAPQLLEVGRHQAGPGGHPGKIMLVAPLSTGGQVTGALIARGHAGELGKSQLDFLATMSEMASQVIDSRQSFQEVQRLASTDGLTGAFNRRFFEANVTNELSRADRLGYSVGLLIIDVDELKMINDVHGHLVGDEVLRSMVRVIKTRIRETDWVARYGGDEFAVVFPGCSGDQLELLAGKLRESLKELVVEAPGGEQLTITFSIGGSVYPESVSVTENLVEAADDAERAAKRAGGDGVVIHKPRWLQQSSGDIA